MHERKPCLRKGLLAAALGGLVGLGCLYYSDYDWDYADDAFEENDYLASAYPLEAGRRLTEIDAGGGVLQDGDLDDYFQTEYLDAGDTLLVYCEFDNSYGDVDIDLFHPDESYAVGSASWTNDYELIRYDVPTAGEHYIYATLFNSADNTYDLWYHHVPAGGSDLYEPNDARVSESAPIAEGFWLSDTAVHDGWAVAHMFAVDEDWYELDVTGAGTVKVWCDFYDLHGDVDIYLYDDTGLNPLALSDGTSDGEYLEWDVSAAETLYLRVVIADSSIQDFNVYDLYWTVE